MPNPDVIGMFQKMAGNGHAPEEGCSLFGVGYEDALERLREKYLKEWFTRGDSAEKFIIGPFGAGKTHFLRQVLEMSRELNCVTSEVALNKDIDFTHNLITYKEIAEEVRAPDSDRHGITSLLRSMSDSVKAKSPDPSQADRLAHAWVAGIDSVDFKLEAFGRVAKKALLALLAHDDPGFEAASRWLGGEVSDRMLCREVGVSVVPKSEEGLHGRRALLSLFQLVRHAGYAGTVVGLDEAEQGLAVDKKRMQKILSMLQSGINAMSDLKGGSALILFAITPDIAEKLEDFPALQQRVSDPIPGKTYLHGDTLAPKIDLTVRGDQVQELTAIGRRLVELFYESAPKRIALPISEASQAIDRAAEDVARNAVQSGNRRTMVKRTCAILLGIYDENKVTDPGNLPDVETDEGEV